MAKEGFSLGLALKQRRNATCEMQLGNRLLADMRQRCLVTNFPLWASEGINLYCPTPAKCKYLNQRRGCKVSRGRHIYIGELANQGQRLLTKWTSLSVGFPPLQWAGKQSNVVLVVVCVDRSFLAAIDGSCFVMSSPAGLLDSSFPPFVS